MLRTQLIRLAYNNPELQKDLLPLITKEAALQGGPVARVLDKYWNMLHDFEGELKSASRVYDVAASYGGGPGEKDAKKVMKGIQDLAKMVDRLASRELEKAWKLEQDFGKRHGDALDYIEQQRDEMFPR